MGGSHQALPWHWNNTSAILPMPYITVFPNLLENTLWILGAPFLFFIDNYSTYLTTTLGTSP